MDCFFLSQIVAGSEANGLSLVEEIARIWKGRWMNKVVSIRDTWTDFYLYIVSRLFSEGSRV